LLDDKRLERIARTSLSRAPPRAITCPLHIHRYQQLERNALPAFEQDSPIADYKPHHTSKPAKICRIEFLFKSPLMDAPP
jgi:hypothetical protein